MTEHQYLSFMKISCEANVHIERGRFRSIAKLDEISRLLDGVYDHNNMSYNISLDFKNVQLWSQHNDMKQNYEVWFDDQMIDKNYQTNTRMDALFHAGRYSTQDYNYIEDQNPNQILKDTWGPNFVRGTAIILFEDPKLVSNTSVFLDSKYGPYSIEYMPVQFILHPRKPNAEMIKTYGIERANQMMNPRMRRKQLKPGVYPIQLGRALQRRINKEWIYEEYIL